MFAYCTKCDYDSGDKDDLLELEEKVKEDGGVLCADMDTPEQCPKCGALGTMCVD